MFNLFKRKNKIKELEMRVLVLESNITKLNAQKEKAIDFSKTFGERFNLKGCTIDGGLIKNAKFSADKVSCGNCDKEVVVPLENTEFINRLASQIEAKISDLVAIPAKVDELKVESKANVDLILQIDGNVIGKIALEQLNKMQRQKGIKLNLV